MIKFKHMKNKITHFLIGILWILAILLGSSFVFNIKFGFNIFNSAHWKYLGQLQASGQQIDKLFYILLAGSIIITIIGLYLLTHQPKRNIIMDAHYAQKKTAHPAIDTKPFSPGIMRPPRLNLEKANNYMAAENNQPNLKQNTSPINIKNNSKELEELFKSSGYTVKKPPKIKNITPVLFAIGAKETLWIGGQNIDLNEFNDAVNKIKSVFIETLEDIKIKVNPFILDENLEYDLIKIYNSIDELKSELPTNPTLKDSDTEDFEAYSEYIDTVSNYLGNI